MVQLKTPKEMTALRSQLNKRIQKRIPSLLTYWEKAGIEQRQHLEALQKKEEALEKKRFKSSMSTGFFYGIQGLFYGVLVGFPPGCIRGINQHSWEVFWGSMLFTGIIGCIIGVLIGIHQGQKEY